MITVYSHPFLYHLAMRLLYGRQFTGRYEVISSQIPDRSQVVEVCCGDCYLYTHYLKRKQVDYLGLDINPLFLDYARKKGVSVRRFDLWKDPIPSAEIVVMQGSLSQFIPHHRQILERLLAAARGRLIVAEPVRNLAASKNPIIAYLAKRLSDPGFYETGNPYLGKRFDTDSLTALFTSFEEFRSFIGTPGKELVGVFVAKPQSATRRPAETPEGS